MLLFRTGKNAKAFLLDIEKEKARVESHKVDIRINEDGEVKFTENIDVEFRDTNANIKKLVPNSYTYKNEKGKKGVQV